MITNAKALLYYRIGNKFLRIEEDENGVVTIKINMIENNKEIKPIGYMIGTNYMVIKP